MKLAPGDIQTFFETMEPDLKRIIAGHPVTTEDGHPCDFIYAQFKTYMLQNSPINQRARWELYGQGNHPQDFPSWFRSMLTGYLKRNRILFQKQTKNPFLYPDAARPKTRTPSGAEILLGMGHAARRLDPRHPRFMGHPLATAEGLEETLGTAGGDGKGTPGSNLKTSSFPEHRDRETRSQGQQHRPQTPFR
jgi:hypothetical protein